MRSVRLGRNNSTDRLTGSQSCRPASSVNIWGVMELDSVRSRRSLNAGKEQTDIQVTTRASFSIMNRKPAPAPTTSHYLLRACNMLWNWQCQVSVRYQYRWLVKVVTNLDLDRG